MLSRTPKYDPRVAEFKPRVQINRLGPHRRFSMQHDSYAMEPQFMRERTVLRDHAPRIREPAHRVPVNILEIAAAHKIPLKSLTMVPCVCTRDGVMIFDEYIKKLRDVKSPSPSYHSSDRSSSSNTNLSESGSGKVIMIHNLSPEVIKDVNPLFMFCSAFGNVDRIKIMFNKRDTAFIQMASVSDANNIIRHCQGLDVWGKTLVIVRSKIDNIHLPYTLVNEDNEELNLTKDFTNSPARRFSPKFEKRRSYICTPTKMLHASNLPDSFDEAEFRAALDPKNNQIVRMKPMTKGNFHMHIIECVDTSAAVNILMFKHLMKFQGNHVRFSFTAATLPPQGELVAYEQ